MDLIVPNAGSLLTMGLQVLRAISEHIFDQVSTQKWKKLELGWTIMRPYCYYQNPGYILFLTSKAKLFK